MDLTTERCYPPENSGSVVSTKGDVDKYGDVVDELTRRLPRSERERAELRDAVARARLEIEGAPAEPRSEPAPPRPVRAVRPAPAPRPPAPRRSARLERVVAAPIRTKVAPRLVTLDELEPETRARAERLLAVIPPESVGLGLGVDADRLAETQACLVALAVSRRAS